MAPFIMSFQIVQVGECDGSGCGDEGMRGLKFHPLYPLYVSHTLYPHFPVTPAQLMLTSFPASPAPEHKHLNCA